MPSAGELLADRYQLVQPIGAGGMAVVWRARDTRLRRQVAVKLLRPELAEDEDLARRFESEARHAASLSHPNIATVHDADVDAGRAFIVMELIDGPSVAEAIAQRGALEPRVAVEIAASAARALSAAHRRGLVHRDVKPANLLIGRDGRVRLTDFGIARALTASSVTAPGTVLGSIPYLSPEQARAGEATASGDVFSLGVVLFEMLTGRLPWEADTPAAMATIRLHTPAPVPSAVRGSLPGGLDAIVGRALAIDPADRYPSARVFADALEIWNREHRRRGRESVVGATTRLAAQVATATSRRLRPRLAPPVAAMAGVARPNPWVSPPATPVRTRRAPARKGGVTRPRALSGPPDRTPTPAAAGAAEEPQRRRAGLLLAALAAVLVIGTATALVLGGGGERAGNALPSPTETALATLPLVPVAPSPAPTAWPSPEPSPTTAPTSTPRPTLPPPTPTPRLTPRPTPPPTPTPAPPGLSAPAAAVVAFYDAVEDHDWDTAIDLWSPSMQQRYPPQEWLIDRFKRTTRIDITRLQTLSIDREAGTARVAVTLVEYRTVEPSPRTFVGAWDLVRIDGRWVLHDPDF